MFQCRRNKHSFPKLTTRIFLDDGIETIGSHNKLKSVNILESALHRIVVVAIHLCIIIVLTLLHLIEEAISVEVYLSSNIIFTLINIVIRAQLRWEVVTTVQSIGYVMDVIVTKVACSRTLDKTSDSRTSVRRKMLSF